MEIREVWDENLDLEMAAIREVGGEGGREGGRDGWMDGWDKESEAKDSVLSCLLLCRINDTRISITHAPLPPPSLRPFLRSWRSIPT